MEQFKADQTIQILFQLSEGSANPLKDRQDIQWAYLSKNNTWVNFDDKSISDATNDLTQTTFGLSRDDSGRFLPTYVDRKILSDDPFQVLDTEGVGELVRIGAERGRSVKPNLKIGICGEHGGDPQSIAFCNEIGLNYVSCSPYRVPVARLAAAHAALDAEEKAKAERELEARSGKPRCTRAHPSPGPPPRRGG